MLRLFSCVGPCGRQLDSLDLKHCSLNVVPVEVLRNVKTLEELNLDSNNILELPKNLFKLEKIRYLSISDNNIKEIPSAIGNCKTLLELDVSRNDLNDLPGALRFLVNLQSLDVSSNSIPHLPDGFCELKSLKLLILNNIALLSLPHDFGRLENLQKLELRDNSLKNLPPSFENLTKLEFLDLGGNDFHFLPPLIEKLQNLTELWLDNNDIKSVPREIGRLSKLQQLDLSENFIESLPEEISGLESLIDLNLEKNKLEHLPDGIGNLRKLSVLKLEENFLCELNSQIGNCVSLEEFNLKECKLTHLPSSIGNLKRLFHLNIDCNRLCELPKELGDCTAMQILSLRDNQLTYLIPQIGNLLDLHVLDLAGNRLPNLPEEISKCPLTALWLSENQAQSIVPLQEENDPVTGKISLTNYMLPQVPISHEYPNLGKTSKDEENGSFEERTSRVRFDASIAKDNDDAYNSDFPKTLFPKKDHHNSSLSDKLSDNNRESPQIRNVDKYPSAKLHINPDSASISTFNQKKPPIDETINGEEDHFPSLDLNSARVNGDSTSSQKYESISQFQIDLKNISSPDTLDPINNSTKSFVNDDTDTNIDVNAPKNVIFENDVIDNEEKSDSKLIRRDTPHYTKRSRITPHPNDSIEGVQEVLKVLSPEKREWIMKLRQDRLENIYYQEIPVTIRKQPGYGLGLSIAGGAGSVPYKGKDTGIYVSRLVPTGLAIQSGLKVGDKIISVNSESMIDVEHNTAVAALRKLDEIINLVVAREVEYSRPDDSAGYELIECTLRKMNDEFGLKIASDSERSKTFISGITPNGSADMSKQIRLGDELVRINEFEAKNLTTNQIYSLLRDSKDQVHLQLMRNNGVHFKDHADLLKYYSDVPPTPPTRGLARDPGSVSPEEFYSVDRVFIQKSDEALGLSICGGIDHDCYPYGKSEPGIYISKISPHGTAFRSGLRIGNKLLSVNGTDLRRATHQEAVDAIISDTSDTLVFDVYRYPQPKDIKDVTISRAETIPLGLRIIGNRVNKNDIRSSLFGKQDEGVYVHSVVPNSLAALDGNFNQGDRILEINGFWLSGSTTQDVIQMIKESKDFWRFTLVQGKADSVRMIQNLDKNSDWIQSVDSLPAQIKSNSPVSLDRTSAEFSTLFSTPRLADNTEEAPKARDYFSSVQDRIRNLEKMQTLSIQ